MQNYTKWNIDYAYFEKIGSEKIHWYYL